MPYYPTLQWPWKTKPTQCSTETRLLERIKLRHAVCPCVCVGEKTVQKGRGVERFFCLGGLGWFKPVNNNCTDTNHKFQLPANRPRQLFSKSMEQISSKTHDNKSHCFQPPLSWLVPLVCILQTGVCWDTVLLWAERREEGRSFISGTRRNQFVEMKWFSSIATAAVKLIRNFSETARTS